MKAFVTFFTIFCFIVAPLNAYADNPQESKGRVASIKVGQIAPFDGILLDTVAGARLHVNRLTLGEEFSLELKTALARQAALHKLQLDILRAELEAEKRLRLETIMIKDAQIQYLDKQLADSLKPSYDGAWFAGGVAAGILLTIGTAYAIAELR